MVLFSSNNHVVNVERINKTYSVMPIILLAARRGMAEANPVNKVNALSFICSEKE